MERLDLDLAKERKVVGWIAWLVLAAGLMLALDVARSSWEAKRRIHAIKTELASLPTRVAPPAAGVPRSPEEIGAARKVIQRIALPWGELFDAIEGARIKGVVLTGIEPDPRAHAVVLNGQAENYLAALNYLNRLRGEPALRNVRLLRHEQSTDARYPLGFSIQANWGRPS